MIDEEIETQPLYSCHDHCYKKIYQLDDCRDCPIFFGNTTDNDIITIPSNDGEYGN